MINIFGAGKNIFIRIDIMIKFREKLGFTDSKGRFHSRQPDQKLSEKLRDLHVTASRYIVHIESANENFEYWDLWLNESPDLYIWIGNLKSLKRNPFPHSGFTIHFKTGGHHPTRNILTDNQKDRLFTAISRVIPKGEIIGSYGTVTKGGISGLQKLERFYGFKKIDEFLGWDSTDETKRVKIPVLKKL